MLALTAFLSAFFFSFVGSIPPGTLNLTIVQIGLQDKMKIAWRFAAAAALVEYPYAWVAIKFEKLITSSPAINENIELISSVILITLGMMNLLSTKKTGKIYERFSSSGFRRGVILSILNPLALPFWIGVTAYLKSLNLITLSTQTEVHSYLAGVSIGAFLLLIAVAYLARRMTSYVEGSSVLKIIPAATLLGLGLYGLYEYFF
jgi:threonine/homoserine/homoserine lactone efflux protein